jgi:predicted naringenin-chalcone synthase
MSLAILGLGTALPATIVSQHDASVLNRELCCKTEEQKTWLPAMYQGTGITTRRFAMPTDAVRDVLNGTRFSGSPFLPTGRDGDRGPTTGERMRQYTVLAPPLALAAARASLLEAAVAPAELTHVVTVSCTGFYAPGLDVALLRDLELRPTVQRTHVGFMGCHGAVNGLRVAGAFTGSDPAARVLLVAVELCSMHYHYTWDPQRMIANALFADGAAAIIGVPDTMAPAASWKIAATGSCLIPGSVDAMTWTIGDYGFEMTLAKRVPDLIARHLRPWLAGWLAQHGLCIEDVASWALHPGGPRILTAVEEALELPASAAAVSRAVFAECGNMSSPTLLFILERLRRCGAPRPCVGLGFGPGVIAEAMLID